MRKVNKTRKNNKFTKRRKQTRSYLGGDKYARDENLQNAQKELPSSSKLEDGLYWLEKASEDHGNPADIEELVNKIKQSIDLVDEVNTKLENLLY